VPAPDISRIQPFGPKAQYVNVIIETPKGSPAKYRYDEETGLIVYDKAMPVGQSFPFDFGFLPSTTGGDGDPLDVLVVTDQPLFPGCLVHGKLLGVIEAEQSEGGKKERNDRLVAVPLQVKSGKPPAGSIERLDAALVQKITQFFVTYNEAQGKKFKVLRSAGPAEAAKLIRAGMSK